MSETQEQPPRSGGVRNSNQPCSVEGCANNAYYRSGLCAMHHRRQQRHGSVGQAAAMRPSRTAKQASR